LPALSTARPCEEHKLLAVTPPLLQVLVVKLPSWPKTRLATVLVSGVV
jgi:hypothetical protein